MALVNNIFTIGFRCNVDEFLINYLKIRTYSSPFSYMVIDIRTALEFIKTKFICYTDTKFIKFIPTEKHDYLFGGVRWLNDIFVHAVSIINDKDIINNNKLCIWNHHDVNSESFQQSMKKRTAHLLKTMNDKPDTLLLFYIEKIQTFKTMTDSYFDIRVLDNFKCNFLIVLPFLNFELDPYLFYDKNNIKIIYFKASLDQWTVSVHCNKDEWKKLTSLLNKLYVFKIDER